jgi:transcription termination factor Rho
VTETVTETRETQNRSDEKGLAGMLLPQLRKKAKQMGISGVSGMRKQELISAISDDSSRPTGTPGDADASGSDGKEQSRQLPEVSEPKAESPTSDTQTDDRRDKESTKRDDRQVSVHEDSKPEERGESNQNRRNKSANRDRQGKKASQEDGSSNSGAGRGQSDQHEPDSRKSDGRDRNSDSRSAESRSTEDRTSDGRRNDGGGDSRGGDSRGGDRQRDRNSGRNQRQGGDRGSRNNERNSSDEDGRRRRRRGRERNRGDRPRDVETVISEDDVLLPVAGILDVLDNYAFVRTSGYLPGPNDVYVSLAMVKRHGMRKGDAISGSVREANDSDRREKYNPLVRVESLNGTAVAEAKDRVTFGDLTPLYPQDRLRLETGPANFTTRVIDIVSPIGKGQRGLIVSPPKAGKTMVLQEIANAITENNPECHLMVVLVDERPEEVTDMQRSVKGEVIASTFDRPADDHTTVAELAIERAKRLVELGHDVVVLLDSMTRLGRAYNLSAPASGRILSGGVDSAALYPPKRFFGAARNIEHGGSLTILATALVETGSKMDEVIFEEFKGTGNMELKLDRRIADKRVFPAIDVDASGTRKEELLMTPEELKIVWTLRRVLHALDTQQAIELLLTKLRDTNSNYEFLLQVQKTTPAGPGGPGEE